MYVAVRRFEGVTDSQKVAQVAKEGFVPLISEMPGFVAYYLVLQPHFIIQSTALRPASVVTAARIGLPSSTPL